MKKNRRQFVAKSRLAVAPRIAVETVEARVLLSSVVYSYVTDQSSYSAAPGQKVTVNVYLKETLNGNLSLISGHGENGLFGAGFEVLSATRPASPAAITAVNYDAADFAGPASISLNNSHVSNPNEADVLESIAITATRGVGLGNGHGAAGNEVYLGSLTIAAGSHAGTTTFALGEFKVSGHIGGNTLTNPDGYDLDANGTKPVPYTGVGAAVTTFSVTTAGPVNRPPVISAQAFTNNSRSLTGAVVGTVVASDPDAGQTLSYVLSANPALHAIDYSGAFQIDAHGKLTVKTPAKLPIVAAGKTATATFKVTVTDNGNPKLSASAIITVTLSSTKTMPPIFKATTQTFTLPATARIGATIGTLAASAAYTGQKITYSLTGADAAHFAISTSGVMTSRSALDYAHPGHHYTLTVVAADGTGAAAPKASVAVTVNVTALAPTITKTVVSASINHAR